MSLNRFIKLGNPSETYRFLVENNFIVKPIHIRKFSTL